MLPIPGIVKVNGADLDVRAEGVLVEQNCASSAMRHMAMIPQVVLEVLDCLLQSDDVPCLRDVFFDGTFFASSRSRIPSHNVEARLFTQAIRHVVVKAIQ